MLLYIYIYIHIKQNILESTQFNITQSAVKFFDRRQHESGQNEFRAAVYCPIYVAGATVHCIEFKSKTSNLIFAVLFCTSTNLHKIFEVFCCERFIIVDPKCFRNTVGT